MIIHVATEQGERPMMQDTYAINYNAEAGVGVFGVFDGHGVAGHEVASQLSAGINGLELTALGKGDVETTRARVEDVLAGVHREWSSRPGTNEIFAGGSTAIVAIVSRLAITNVYVGDGIARFYPDSASPKELMLPHNSDNPAEIERVTSMGYGDTIEPVESHPTISRFGGLLVSRAIGTSTEHWPYISAIPQVSTVDREPGLLALATDGVYGHHQVWGPNMFDAIMESVREHDLYGSEAQAERMASNGSAANRDNAAALLIGLPPTEFSK